MRRISLMVCGLVLLPAAGLVSIGCGSAGDPEPSGQSQSSATVVTLRTTAQARGYWSSYNAKFSYPNQLPPVDGSDQAIRNRNIAVGGAGWVFLRGDDPGWGSPENQYVYKTNSASNTLITMAGGAQQLAASPTGQSWAVSDDCRIWSQHDNGDDGYDLRNGCVASGSALAVNANGEVWALGKDTTYCGGQHCVFQGFAPPAPAPIAWRPIAGHGADMITTDPSSGTPWIVSGRAILRFDGSSFVTVDLNGLPVDSVVSIAVNYNSAYGTSGNAYVVGAVPASNGHVFRQTLGPNSAWEELPDAVHEFTSIAAYGNTVIAIATDNTVWYWVDNVTK